MSKTTEPNLPTFVELNDVSAMLANASRYRINGLEQQGVLPKPLMVPRGLRRDPDVQLRWH